MRQILPGRPQATQQALGTVNWDGLRVIAYISGRNAIIFNGRREILQTINVDDASNLGAISIEEHSGRIALCDQEHVYLYQPAGRDSGDLHWSQSAVISVQSGVNCISWASDEELVIAGQKIGLWRILGHAGSRNIWHSDLSNSISQAHVSPDGALIASAGQYDRVVKIWRRLSWEQDSTRFDVSYLLHPSTVVNCMWRRPWYSEQSLDNLLYTFASDNYVRVWTHADPHAHCVMREVACVDLNTSIQPRRMSIGSMSRRRFAFIIHSRDLSFAAERIVQSHRQGTDHALEHLIEIANRSPEICVILDGLGHMSVVGLENAGHKNKRDAELFNIALVDGVNITLAAADGRDDCTIIHAFASHDASASLCILVQSYTGQIDWYQGSFVDFLDTARRAKRLTLQSSWAGHAASIEGISGDCTNGAFISWTAENSAIVWRHDESRLLIPANRLILESKILCVKAISSDLILALHPEELTLWQASETRLALLARRTLNRNRDRTQVGLEPQILAIRGTTIILLYQDGIMEQYGISGSTVRPVEGPNGYHETITFIGTLESQPKSALRTDFHVTMGTVASVATKAEHISGVSLTGELRSYSVAHTSSSESYLKCENSIATTLKMPRMLADSAERYLALVHHDRRSISIWSEVQHSQELFYQFHGNTEVRGLQWTQIGSHLVLLIWLDHNFCAIRKSRYCDQSPAWVVHGEVRVREYTTYIINAACWLNHAQVAVAAGSQILTFDAFEDIANRHADASEVAVNCIVLSNSTLPIFDPIFVSHLLLAGQMARVEDMFERVHAQVKYLSDVELVKSTLGLTVLEVSEVHTTNSREQIDEVDLAVYSESISKIPTTQLDDAQKTDLSRLLRTTSYLHDSATAVDHLSRMYLQAFLTSAQESPAFAQAIPYSAILAATLSKTPEALLEHIQSYLAVHHPDLKLSWPLARKLGLLLFLPASSTSSSNPETTMLRDLFEQIARNEYNNPRNPDIKSPVDCSLYYLALSKKSVLQSLWRRTVGIKEKENTMRLLANDFTQQKWKATALKNAYALLSKRRFEYAAAFFLLGGALNDAVNVCINQLDDLQLGIVVARVWYDEAEGARVMKNLIEGKMRQLVLDTCEIRFISAWGRVYLDDLAGAIRYLVLHVDVLFKAQLDARADANAAGQSSASQQRPPRCLSFQANEPTALIELYKYLRDKLHVQGKWVANEERMITPYQEWSFVMRCVNWYCRAGLDILALQLVRTWKFVEWQKEVATEGNSLTDKKSVVAYVDDISGLEDMLGVGSSVTSSRQETPAVQKVITQEKKPAPTQFVEPSADSLLDSFGF